MHVLPLERRGEKKQPFVLFDIVDLWFLILVWVVPQKAWAAAVSPHFHLS